MTPTTRCAKAAFIPLLMLTVLAVPRASSAAAVPAAGRPAGEPIYRQFATDPRARSQWALDAIHADRGWLLAGLGSVPSIGGPVVGVIDSGIDPSHEDIRGRILACASASGGRVREGICDDRTGHGSHVAGIIAAATGNGIGIAGVAAGSPLVVCRAIAADGTGETADIAACLGWTVRKKAKVVNMSLGGPDSRLIHTAVTAASDSGALLVAAAGNGGRGDREYPAGYREVVSVAATDRDGRRAEFSGSNPDVEIAAPGVDILSLAPGNRYRSLSGTSMAAPHVAGAAALIWQAHPTADAAAIRRLLDRSVRDAGKRGRDGDYGFGVLDLAAAT